MGLGSWAKKHLAIRFDSHTLGNLAKNAAPVAGTVIGGPLGLAAAGTLGAVGDLGRGKNIGQALKSGVSSAGQAGLGQAAGSLAGYHGGIGSFGGNAGGLSGHAASVAPPGTPPIGSIGAKAAEAGGGAIEDTVSTTGGGFLDGLQSAGGRVLSFAEAHPNAASGALQGIGSIASSGAENRLRNAEAANLEQRIGETQFDFDQRKRKEQQYAPVWSQLSGPMTGGYANLAKNPYAPGP